MAKTEPGSKRPRPKLGTTSTDTRERSRRTAGPTKRGPTVLPRTEPVPTDEHIRVRAYYLYLERDGRPGDPLDDWLRAEHELNGFTRNVKQGTLRRTLRVGAGNSDSDAAR
jgi:hypothetical protein